MSKNKINDENIKITIAIITLVLGFIFFNIPKYIPFVAEYKFKKLINNLLTNKISSESYWKEREFLCPLTHKIITNKSKINNLLNAKKEIIKLEEGSCFKNKYKTYEFLIYNPWLDKNKQKPEQLIKNILKNNFNIYKTNNNIYLSESNNLIAIIYPYKNAKKNILFKDLTLPENEYNYFWLTILQKM